MFDRFVFDEGWIKTNRRLIVIRAIVDFIISLFSKKPDTVFEQPIKDVKNDIKDIEKKEKVLEESGVKDLTLEEELDYWKKK